MHRKATLTLGPSPKDQAIPGLTLRLWPPPGCSLSQSPEKLLCMLAPKPDFKTAWPRPISKESERGCVEKSAKLECLSKGENRRGGFSDQTRFPDSKKYPLKIGRETGRKTIGMWAYECTHTHYRPTRGSHADTRTHMTSLRGRADKPLCHAQPR